MQAAVSSVNCGLKVKPSFAKNSIDCLRSCTGKFTNIFVGISCPFSLCVQVNRYGPCALLLSRTSVHAIDSGPQFFRSAVASGTRSGRSAREVNHRPDLDGSLPHHGNARGDTDRSRERLPLSGAFAPLWANPARGVHRPCAVVTPAIPSRGRQGASRVHSGAGGPRIEGLLRHQGGVGDSDLAHGASFAMQDGTEFVQQGP